MLKVVLLVTLLGVAARHAQGQGSITIVGPPNGTHITDCETGQLIGGGYTAAIFWAPGTISDPSAFVQVGGTMSIINGQLAGGTRTPPSPGSSAVNLFAAAWETSAGATYEAASQVFGAKVGRSEIVSAIPSGPAVRFPDFQVCPVPEPSTWVLFGSGLLAVALQKRVSRRN